MSHLNRLGTLALLACIIVMPTGCTSSTSNEPAASGPSTDAVVEDPGPTHLSPKGEVVRVAYNKEGWVTLGYRIANNSVGEDWMLLEVGMTVIGQNNNQSLGRDAVSLSTPDGKTIPLATQQAFTHANLRALDRRANMVRDSIDYFPAKSHRPCRIGFFTDVSGSRGMAWDTVSLNPQSPCFGRLYFEVPGGIRYGQHFLNVQFKGGLIRVPFKIMTAEELKQAVAEYQRKVKESKAEVKEKR